MWRKKIILETEKDLSNKLIINFYNLEQKYLELKNELTTEISNLKNRIFTLEKDNIQSKQEIIELKEKTEKIKKLKIKYKILKV